MLKPEDILKTEYSTQFDEFRKNRILVSFHKYGPIRENFGNKLVDAIGSLEKCIAKYKETGNTEYLLDAANYGMFEFMYPQHPRRTLPRNRFQRECRYCRDKYKRNQAVPRHTIKR